MTYENVILQKLKFTLVQYDGLKPVDRSNLRHLYSTDKTTHWLALIYLNGVNEPAK